VAETYNSFSDLINGVKNASKAVISNLGENKKPTKSEIKKLKLTTKKTTEVIDKMLKQFDKYYPNPTDPQIIAQRAEMVANANLLKKCNECSESFLKDTSPASAPTTPKSGPFFDENNSFGLLINNACTDSLTKLASKPFQEFVVKLNLLEKIPTKVQEALYKIKTEVAAKKPTVDLSEIFKSDYPNNFDISNVTVLLNGKQVKLSSFNLGKNGDYVLDIKDWSTETQAKDKILFAGAATSTDKILAIEASNSAISDVKSYLKLVKELTGKQLKEIFPGTSQDRCDEVAKLINKYADKFEITIPLRMAHFLGQIGIESNKLNAMGEKSGENPCYTKTNNAWDYDSGQGDGWIAKKKWSETPINEGCDDFKKSLKGERKHPNWNSIKDVPKKYVCTNDNPAAISGKNLFNYVYRCEGGNGDEGSGDGFRYRGHGVMQLTWKKQYVAFNDWLKTNGFVNDYKKVLSDPDEGFIDKEIDILSAMWYWDKEKINDVADKVKKESNLESFKKVTLKINKQALANKDRNDIFKAALNILK
jgi:predicted chitinase